MDFNEIRAMLGHWVNPPLLLADNEHLSVWLVADGKGDKTPIQDHLITLGCDGWEYLPFDWCRKTQNVILWAQEVEDETFVGTFWGIWKARLLPGESPVWQHVWRQPRSVHAFLLKEKLGLLLNRDGLFRLGILGWKKIWEADFPYDPIRLVVKKFYLIPATGDLFVETGEEVLIFSARSGYRKLVVCFPDGHLPPERRTSWVPSLKHLVLYGVPIGSDDVYLSTDGSTLGEILVGGNEFIRYSRAELAATQRGLFLLTNEVPFGPCYVGYHSEEPGDRWHFFPQTESPHRSHRKITACSRGAMVYSVWNQGNTEIHWFPTPGQS